MNHHEISQQKSKKSKKRKVAKTRAKSKESTVEEELEDDSNSDSSLSSSTKGFKIERPSVVFNRRRREVKKQEAKLKVCSIEWWNAAAEYMHFLRPR